MNWYEFVGYVLIPVLMYFAGVQRERRRHAREDVRHERYRAEDLAREVERERHARIEKVVAEYGRLAFGRPRISSQLPGFMTAGARDLADGEIREAVEAIVRRWGAGLHPLGMQHERILRLTDLREFLRRLHPNAQNLEDVLAELENRA